MFSEAVYPGSGNMTVTNSADADDVLSVDLASDSAAVFSDSTLSVTLGAGALKAGVQYIVHLPSYSVRNSLGNWFAPMSSAASTNGTTFSFTTMTSTTVDTSAPSVSSSTPADGASDVEVGSKFVVTFSESVYIAHGSATLTISRLSSSAAFAVNEVVSGASSGSSGIVLWSDDQASGVLSCHACRLYEWL